MIKVGLPMFWMTLAMVKVLPDPVTPIRVWYFSPVWKARVNFSMAWGWSPAGWKGDSSLKRDMAKNIRFGFAGNCQWARWAGGGACLSRVGLGRPLGFA